MQMTSVTAAVTHYSAHKHTYEITDYSVYISDLEKFSS